MKSLIRIKHKGNFNKTEQFFNRVLRRDYLNVLARYGEAGVQMLSLATPVDSGATAQSWEYGIENMDGKTTIYWTNSHENEGVSIAILLIYGHGTQNGSFVQGINFVDPAIRPVFEQMANEVWKEVTR